MELSQLRSFLYVAEQGNVSRAAALLDLSQPTVSRQIRELEAELRTSLFRRNGHGVELTPAGHRFTGHASEVLRSADSALHAMRPEPSDIEGHISGGLPPSLGELAIPPIAACFKKRFPRAVLSIVEGGSGLLYDLVLSNRLDFAVVRNPITSSQVTSELLCVESLYVIGARPFGFQGGPIGLTELSQLPLIMPTLLDSKRTLLDPAFSRGEFNPNIVMEVDSITSTITLVQAGFGYAVIPESTISVLPKTKPNLSCQLIDVPGVVATVCFISSKKFGATSLRAKAARMFRDEVANVLGGLREAVG